MERFEVEQATIDQIKDRILDEKYFTARLLAQLSQKTKIPPIEIVQYASVPIGLYLLFGTFNYFLANLLLIAYPLVVTYIYTEEKPTRDQLLIFWGCFSILTLFDRALEHIFGYYLVKIALLLLLFLEPYRYAAVIKCMLSEYKNRKSQETAKSPPPEKPDQDAFNQNPKRPNNARSPNSEQGNKVVMPPVEVKQKSMKSSKAAEPTPEADPPTARRTLSARTPVVKDDENNNAVSSSTVPTGKSEFVPTPSSKNSVRSIAFSDIPGRQAYTGPNPMLTDSAYMLKSSASFTSTGNSDIGPGVNLHDLLFLPGNKLVFNAPFDHDDLTYHMRIMNTSHHPLAFAIKGNAVPRVVCYPPSGVMQPQEKLIIAVTVRKFSWNDVDFNKDRVAFEYVLLKDAQKDVKTFSHKLLQTAEMKRRKNILIQYNP